METVVAVCQREPGETVNEKDVLALESVDILLLPLLFLPPALLSRLLVGICNLKSPREIPRIFTFLFSSEILYVLVSEVLLISCFTLVHCSHFEKTTPQSL